MLLPLLLSNTLSTPKTDATVQVHRGTLNMEQNLDEADKIMSGRTKSTACTHKLFLQTYVRTYARIWMYTYIHLFAITCVLCFDQSSFYIDKVRDNGHNRSKPLQPQQLDVLISCMLLCETH